MLLVCDTLLYILVHLIFFFFFSLVLLLTFRPIIDILLSYLAITSTTCIILYLKLKISLMQKDRHHLLTLCFLKLKERQKYIQGLIANVKIVIFRFVNFPFLLQYFSFSCICALRSQLLEHVSIIEVVKLPKTKYLTNILNNIV